MTEQEKLKYGKERQVQLRKEAKQARKDALEKSATCQSNIKEEKND